MASNESLARAFFSQEHRTRGVGFARRLLVGWVSAAIIAGCASTELAPAAPNADGAAVVRTSSVEVRAQVRPAHPDVPSSLTPIEITVRNLSPGTITVALSDIELFAPDARLPAISPETIRLERPLGLGLDPLSPFAAGAAASSATASGSAARQGTGPVFDPSETYAMGADADHRRRELESTAFTEGSIDRGEMERGVVYFETDKIEGDRVNLRVVVRAGTDRGVAQVLEIPFTVQS